MTAHRPPELEAVELDGAWYVRTKPEIDTPEIVADLSMARYGKAWATRFVASQQILEALKMYLVEVPIDEVIDYAEQCKGKARAAIAAAEGRTEQ